MIVDDSDLEQRRRQAWACHLAEMARIAMLPKRRIRVPAQTRYIIEWNAA